MVNENRYLKWLSAETGSKYWHDSAVKHEQATAFENGAVGITTNPFLVNAALSKTPSDWQHVFSSDLQALDAPAYAEELTHRVISFYLDRISGVYKMDRFAEGYICAQGNPRNHFSEEKMLEEAHRLHSWAPNVVIKLPATAAGLRTYETCASLGYNVAMTVSFTVPQVIQAGLAAERGRQKAIANGITPGLSIAVMMVGRLDDYLRDVATDNQAQVTEEEIRCAGVACMKKAYRYFVENNLSCMLMPAGCRGGYHISSFSGAKNMIMSVGPAVFDQLAALDGNFHEQIDEEVDKETIEHLLRLPEFRKAYEFDGMRPEEFITYGATNRTLTQFIESGWNQLEKYPIPL